MVATVVLLRSDFISDEKDQILHRWESVNSLIYGVLQTDVRTAMGYYVGLAWSILKGYAPAAMILDSLTD